VPSGYRNKNSKVRYSFVQDPNDPSGKTKVRTEHGLSTFEVKTDSIEYVPLDDDLHPASERLEDMPTVDMSQHVEAPDLTAEFAATMAPYSAVFHEPVSVKQIEQRGEEEAPHQFDYMALAREMDFNLGQSLMHIWLAFLSKDGEKMDHLRQARFHLADEMQRTR
jgi:hypothetical protein